jgi:hypothetical protein
MLCAERGGMTEVLAAVAAIAGACDCLVLAERFSHRGIPSGLQWS